MNRFLCHERLLVRFISLVGICTVLFLIAWTFSYSFLPEGVMRGRTGSVIAGDEGAASFHLEFLRIAAFNLVAMGLIVAANSQSL
jgi:hypothetical protein